LIVFCVKCSNKSGDKKKWSICSLCLCPSTVFPVVLELHVLLSYLWSHMPYPSLSSHSHHMCSQMPHNVCSFILKCLCFLGMYCLKIILPLKSTITSFTARCSEGSSYFEYVPFSKSEVCLVSIMCHISGHYCQEYCH
jgi:hypothetical protein